MLLDHTDDDGAQICAARILASVRALAVPHGAVMLSVGASIGIASFADAAATPSELMARADKALYRAKRADGGCAMVERRVVTVDSARARPPRAECCGARIATTRVGSRCERIATRLSRACHSSSDI